MIVTGKGVVAIKGLTEAWRGVWRVGWGVVPDGYILIPETGLTLPGSAGASLQRPLVPG